MTSFFTLRPPLVKADDKLVAVVGLEDVVVVATKDATLVAHKDHVQDAKVIASKIKADGRSEWELHREVFRPWGKYDSIDNGQNYQVKRITVNPGAKLRSRCIITELSMGGCEGVRSGH